MAAGMTDAVFWDSTLREVEAVLEQHNAHERRQDLRIGLVASTLVNINRRKGAKFVQPQDFFKVARQSADYMTPEQAALEMTRWATSHNKAHAPVDAGGAQ